jgi:hypothetical protein
MMRAAIVVESPDGSRLLYRLDADQVQFTYHDQGGTYISLEGWLRDGVIYSGQDAGEHMAERPEIEAPAHAIGGRS